MSGGQVITKVRLSAKQNRQEPRNSTLNQVPGPLHIIFMKYNIIYDGYPPPHYLVLKRVSIFKYDFRKDLHTQKHT